MSRFEAISDVDKFINDVLSTGKQESMKSPSKIMELLGIHTDSGNFLETLPFSLNDTTAGSENELQVAVEGVKTNVDLPFIIEQSNYFKNIIRRAATGDASKKVCVELEKYLNSNAENIWENSWVRLPKRVLSQYANDIFTHDLQADKKSHSGQFRSDANRFIYHEQGEVCIRIPISYLLKLSLADSISSPDNVPEMIKRTGEKLMRHFLNDNTSPETFSFYVVPLQKEFGMGKAVARESSLRYLFTQLLVMYANEKFKLKERGQKAHVYCSALPPIRQGKLNEVISDSFYRELFMNPCLSGWDIGEAKSHYMHLCHQVLSRSQLNAVAKLRDADIITNNLVVLPNTSNISLANNGTHVSLGSKILSRFLSDTSSRFTRVHEKYLGDLAIKIVEHFLPLFVGTYSAAPYRLDFTDFCPEKALRFLPHELDYTHLRMIWRRWGKKADIRRMGLPITPFGPVWLDKLIQQIFRLKGDFVPDFRLIDYLVSLMSTSQSPALNGIIGNDIRLKKDLADLGVFDTKMSLYLLYKLREYHLMGFSGFEGRHYSLFAGMEEDMGNAVNLQMLLNALAYKYIATGAVSHEDIPDDPTVESERRQIFFGTAIGIPTFFVHKNTENHLLKRILRKTQRVRYSHRYSGYLRVYNLEYCKALVQMIQEDAADLIEMFNIQETMEDLHKRLDNGDSHSATGKLTRGILNTLGARSPMDIQADEFNYASEKYYRNELRRTQMEEAFRMLEEELARINSSNAQIDAKDLQKAFYLVLEGRDVRKFVLDMKYSELTETVTEDNLRRLIYIMLIVFHYKTRQSELDTGSHIHHVYDSAQVS